MPLRQGSLHRQRPAAAHGLCHCTSCRKESGSLYTAYAVWPRSAFSSTGEAMEWQGRSFCPICGSRLFAQRADEARSKSARSMTRLTAWSRNTSSGPSGGERWLPPVPGARAVCEDRP